MGRGFTGAFFEMNNAEKALVNELAPLLSQHGFEWRAKRELFVRPALYGFSDFSWASFSTAEEGDKLELRPAVGVRHDVVENIVNQLGLTFGDENKRYTATVLR